MNLIFLYFEKKPLLFLPLILLLQHRYYFSKLSIFQQLPKYCTSVKITKSQCLKINTVNKKEEFTMSYIEFKNVDKEYKMGEVTIKALDYKTGKQILKLLQDTCRKNNITVIIVTHNAAIAPMADKVIHFKNGTAESIDINQNPLPVEQIEW